MPWAVVFDRVDLLPRHPVQLYEATAYLLILVLLLRVYRQNGALRDGLLTGSYLSLVFLARLVLEFWKTPQAAYESGAAISVGQWLSVPFIVAGAVLIWRALQSARSGPPHSAAASSPE